MKGVKQFNSAYKLTLLMTALYCSVVLTTSAMAVTNPTVETSRLSFTTIDWQTAIPILITIGFLTFVSVLFIYRIRHISIKNKSIRIKSKGENNAQSY